MVNWQKVIGTSFCLLFLLVPLIWLPNTSELFEFNKIIAVYLFTIVICGAWTLRMISEKRFILRRTPVDIPLLIFLGVSLVSLLFSIDIHTSWYGYYSRWNGGLISLVSYALLYWAMVSNLDKKIIPLLLKSLLAGSVVVAVYGIFEHFGFSPSCLVTRHSWGVDCWVQDVKNRVFATLGQPNWLAAYLVAIIWLPLSAMTAKLEIKNWRQIVLFVLLFSTVLFTKSRSGILAFGISSLVYWGLLWKSSQAKISKPLIVFSLITVLLTFAFPNPVRDLVVRSATPAPVGPALEVGGTESGEIRKIVWTGAIRIWTGNTKNFLIGTGPETFAQSYYQYRPVEHNQTSEWELLYNKAHNEFLNQLATTGLLGTGAYLFLLISMAYVLWRNHKTSIGLALFAGWLTIHVTNFWGFSVVMVQLLLFLFPALSQILEQESKDLPPKSLSSGQKVLIALTTGLALLFTVWTVNYWRADTKYASATNAIKSFQASLEPAYLVSAYKLYSQAFSLNKSEPAISSELSVSAAYLANSAKAADATAASQLAQISVAASDKAIATSPHHPNYYKSRARSLILLSDIDGKYLTLAAEALQKAQEISPTDPRIPFNLGVVQSYLGATPSALLEFKKSLELKPDFADPKKQLEEINSSK